MNYGCFVITCYYYYPVGYYIAITSVRHLSYYYYRNYCVSVFRVSGGMTFTMEKGASAMLLASHTVACGTMGCQPVSVCVNVSDYIHCFISTLNNVIFSYLQLCRCGGYLWSNLQ